MKIPALIVLTVAGSVNAQQPAEAATQTGFVVTAGADTIAVERYSRAGSQLKSDLLVKAQGIRITFTMTVAPDGTVPSLVTEARRADSPSTEAPLQRAALDFERDSVLVTVGAATAPTQRFAAREGTLPFINLSSAVVEQILLRAKVLGGATADIPLFAVSGGQMLAARVHWTGGDSATISLGGATIEAKVSHDGHFLGGTVPEQGVRFTLLEDGSRPSQPSPTPPPSPAPDYSAPPGAPYAAEEVRVPAPRAGIELAGTLTIPDHAAGARLPAVAMITGSGPQDRDEASPALPGWRPFRQIADTLGRRGIAVLRLDDRGVGGTPAGPPNPTTADFADDTRAALAYLRARADIDPARIGLIGHSEGAIIAPMVAATDSSLRAVVLIAGSSRTGRQISDAQVRTAIEQQFHLSGASLDSAVHANDAARDSVLATSAWASFWFDYDPIPTARKVRVPVLIVQGATDTQVSPDQAAELAAAIRSGGNDDVTVRIIPETNHLMVHDPDGSFTGYSRLASLDVNPAVLGTIADWLVARMR